MTCSGAAIACAAGVLLAAAWPVQALRAAPPDSAAPPASASVAPAAPFSALALSPFTTTTRLAPGVRLLQAALPEGTSGGPLLITAVEADPAVTGVTVRAALAADVAAPDGKASRGRETVSWLTAQQGALAGINAAFFPYTPVPIGLQVQDGDFVTPPGYHRCVFWIGRDGSPHFDILTFQATVADASGATVSIANIDRRMTHDALVLYTPRFFSRTPAAPGRFETLLRGNVNDIAHAGAAGMPCAIVSSAEGGATPLAPGTFVLSAAPGPEADLLRRGASGGAALTVRLGMQDVAGRPFDLAPVAQAVAGGPRLVTGGGVTVDAAQEGFTAAFAQTPASRSGVGVTADGKILLVTVDGRQPGLSRGLSLTDFAALLRSLGCTDAMNLDGGGSSTLSVRGFHVNSPSDGAERPVASALLVIRAAMASAPAVVAGSATPTTIAVGQTLSLSDGPPGSVWGVRGGIGYVSQADRRFHALRPGPGTIGNGGPYGDIPVLVVGSAAGATAGFAVELSLQPASDTDAATLLIRVRNADGDPLTNTPIAIDVTGGTAATRTATTDGQGVARIGIVWDASTLSVARRITVSSPTGAFSPASLPTPISPPTR